MRILTWRRWNGDVLSVDEGDEGAPRGFIGMAELRTPSDLRPKPEMFWHCRDGLTINVKQRPPFSPLPTVSQE